MGAGADAPLLGGRVCSASRCSSAATAGLSHASRARHGLGRPVTRVLRHLAPRRRSLPPWATMRRHAHPPVWTRTRGGDARLGSGNTSPFLWPLVLLLVVAWLVYRRTRPQPVRPARTLA